MVEDHRGTRARAPRRRGPGRLRLAALGDPRRRGPAAAVRRGDDRRSIAPAHRRDRTRRRRGRARRGRLPGRRPERRRAALLARARPARCSRAGRSSTSPAGVDGVRFTERGQAELKGLDQPVHVVAVRSEDQDAAEAIAPFVRSTAPAHPRRRWKVVAAVVAFAVLAALVAVPLARDGRRTRRSLRTRSASWTRSPARSPRRWGSTTARGRLPPRPTPCG